MTFKVKHNKKVLVSIKAVWIWCINDFPSWLFTYNNFHWNCVRSRVCFWVRGQKVFTFLLLLHCWLNRDLQTTHNKNWNVTTVSRVCERASPLHPETVFVKAVSLLISDFKLTFSAFKSIWMKFISSLWSWLQPVVTHGTWLRHLSPVINWATFSYNVDDRNWNCLSA